MTMVKEGELLDFDYIFCPLCDYRTGVASWRGYGVENAKSALISHLVRKRHSMDRQSARELAKQQQVVKKGTLIPAALPVVGDTEPPAQDQELEFANEVIERTVTIIRLVDELKEDVLLRSRFQPAFDGGMLEAVNAILRANIPDDDPRVVAEHNRQMNSRLQRALLAASPVAEGAKPDPVDVDEHDTANICLSIDQDKVNAELKKDSRSYVVTSRIIEQPNIRLERPSGQVQSTVSMVSPETQRARTLRTRLLSSGVQPLSSDDLDRHINDPSADASPRQQEGWQDDYRAALEVLPDSLGRSLAARIQLVLDNMRRESHIGCELRRELDGGIERDAKAIEDRWPDAAAHLRSHAHIEDGV